MGRSTPRRCSSESYLVLPLEQFDVVDIGGVVVARVGDDNCQPHGNFRRCHRHDDKDKDLPVEIIPLAAEGMSVRLTLLSINSTHINRISALRRVNTPIAPMVKIRPLRIR